MKSLHLYTEKYFTGPRLKHLAKIFLGRAWRGPQAVERSLIAGLTELGQPFDVNVKPGFYGTVGVLSGVNTLREAIKWKGQGKIKKIIAGPNLVVTPEDHNKLIQLPAIDIVLQPCQWCVDFYSSLAPSLRPKLRIWPAGVRLPERPKTAKSTDFLVYNKTGQSELFLGIMEFLKKNNFSFVVLEYGKFKQADYFKALAKSKNLIYLSESESQGLAMFEAWARGVATLVWDRGFWESGKYSWQGRTASPYVTKENGMVFKDLADFSKLLPEFVKSVFHPREFIEKDFTFKRSAEKYLEVYRSM
jgi:glycosyltransferase involved in cell wall biosynthesis